LGSGNRFGRVDLGKHEGELVPPDAGYGVLEPLRRAEQRRDLLENGVPEVVTALVVDRFQAVAVEHHDRELTACPLSPLKLLAQAQGNATRVERPCEEAGPGCPPLAVERRGALDQRARMRGEKRCSLALLRPEGRLDGTDPPEHAELVPAAAKRNPDD